MRRFLIGAVLCLATTATAGGSKSGQDPYGFNQSFWVPDGAVAEFYERGPRSRSLQERAGMRVRAGWTGALFTGADFRQVGAILDGSGRVRCVLSGEGGTCPWLSAWCDDGESSVRTGTCRWD